MTDQNRFAGVSMIIIDDNDTTRAMLRAILRAEGVEVVAEAKDGSTGLALIRKLRPVIVCLDVMMPDMRMMCAKHRNGEHEEWYNFWYHRESQQFIENWDDQPMEFK